MSREMAYCRTVVRDTSDPAEVFGAIADAVAGLERVVAGRRLVGEVKIRGDHYMGDSLIGRHDSILATVEVEA